MIKKLFAYLLIKPEQLIQQAPKIWKASVLRIIALSCLLLAAAVVWDTNHTHIQSLLFLFFNVCVALAVFRVLHTLKKATVTYQSLNSQVILSKEVYKDVFENSGAASLILDTSGRILKVNKMFLKLTGFAKKEVLNRNIADFILDCDLGSMLDSASTSCQLATRDGGTLDCKARHTQLSEQGRCLFSLSDVSIVKKAEQSLIEYERKKQYLKHYDPLTRLPNRDRLLLCLENHIDEAVGSDEVFAVMTFRVNYFRYIDQKYGTTIGDTLLSTLAKQMAPLVAEHFMLARLRGIVFCLVTRLYRDYEAVVAAVEALHNRLPVSLPVNDIDIPISYCCGVSVCPVNSSGADELIKQSEKALDLSRTAFSVKPVFFDGGSHMEKNNQIEIELAIKKALENNDLYTLFQPKVLHDGSVVGAEVLVRMGGQNADTVTPDLFIPAAERCGLIREIEEWVIVSLCQFIRRSQDAGTQLPPIAVNISSRTIVNADYADKLIKLIGSYNIPPSCIELEITETSLMMGRDKALKNLVKLKKFGFAISIDDFGTGYSSLGQIIDMPVSTLKIDRSFLAKIPRGKNHVTLVRTIINLGKQLNLKLVAEGVEKAEQLAFLRNEGCDIFQGYYFYKPLREDELTELIAQQSCRSQQPADRPLLHSL